MRSRSLLILAFILLTLFAFFVSAAHAAPDFVYQKTILPVSDDTYDLGSSDHEWNNLYVKDLHCTGTGCSGGGGGSAAWGDITGTLSDQTDLQDALDLKISVGTTSIGSITALPSLTLPYSQLSGTPTIPTFFSYPFPSNATSTKLTFSGGLSTTYASTTAVSGTSLCIGSDCKTSWPSGTVSSVALSVPTGLSVSGSPITTSGTLALSFTSGYSIPTTASQTNWDTAYTNRITTATYPVQISSNAVSLAFGTTTNNTWSGTNTFASNKLTVSGLSDGCVEIASGLLTSTGDNCGTGSGGITSLNGLTGSSQTFATSTSGGLDLHISSSGSAHTFTIAPASGYLVPLSASTTNWNTFYNTPSNRITAGTGLSWSGNTLNADAASIAWGDITGTLSSQTDLQSALDLKADTSDLAAVATSGAYSDLSGTPTIPTNTSDLTNDSGFITSLSGFDTGDLAEGSNLYFTNTRADARVVSVLSATTSLPNITTLSSLSLPYSQITGTPSLTSYFTLSAWYATTTDGLAQGSVNKYWSNTLFDNRLSATTSLPALATASNLGTVKTSLSGVLKAASGVLSAASEGTDYQGPISLTTTGTSGAATFDGSTLNIPNYATGSSFSYPFPSNATTTKIDFQGGLAIDSGTRLQFSGPSDDNWSIGMDGSNNINVYMSGAPGGRLFRVINHDTDLASLSTDTYLASTTINNLLNVHNASTTVLSAGTLCLTGDDCITSWPSGGGAPAWGDITGTLSDQTDLQSALDAKLSLSSWFATTTAPQITTLGNLGTVKTSITGLVKASSGVLSAASSGTDYAPATSGSSVLKGNGSGGFSSASNGTDYTLLSAVSCTNQVLTALTASGGSTCSSVSNAMLAGSIATSKLSDFGSLSANRVLWWNGSNIVATGTPSFTAGFFIGTSTATSTFGGGLKSGSASWFDNSGTTTVQDTNGLQFGNGSHGVRVVPGSSTTTLEFF